MVKRDKANYLIQSVSHSLDVLEEMCKTSQELGVTELSKRLKLHKNNIFRLLATLELRGFVEQNPQTENYRLGVRALQLGQSYVQSSSLIARAMPIVKNLSDEIGETVSIAILQHGQVYYPISLESKRPVKVAGRVASSLNAKSCASGRLLIAQLSDAALNEILATDTPQDAAIKNSLSELRSTGLIIDKGASEADVITIARIIKGNGSETIGAIEVMLPQYRAKLEAISSKIEDAAMTLTSVLGASNSKSSLSASLEKEVVNSATSTGISAGAIAAASAANAAVLGRIK